MAGIRDDDLPSCGVVGVHPSVLGIIASVQVSETVRVLTGKTPALYGKVLYVDLGDLSFNLLEVPPDPDCRICGGISDPRPFRVEDRFFEETCARDGRRNFIITPRRRLHINLNELKRILKQNGLSVDSAGRMGVTLFLKCGA